MQGSITPSDVECICPVDRCPWEDDHIEGCPKNDYCYRGGVFMRKDAPVKEPEPRPVTDLERDAPGERGQGQGRDVIGVSGATDGS